MLWLGHKRTGKTARSISNGSTVGPHTHVSITHHAGIAFIITAVTMTNMNAVMSIYHQSSQVGLRNGVIFRACGIRRIQPPITNHMRFQFLIVPFFTAHRPAFHFRRHFSFGEGATTKRVIRVHVTRFTLSGIRHCRCLISLWGVTFLLLPITVSRCNAGIDSRMHSTLGHRSPRRIGARHKRHSISYTQRTRVDTAHGHLIASRQNLLHIDPIICFQITFSTTRTIRSSLDEINRRLKSRYFVQYRKLDQVPLPANGGNLCIKPTITHILKQLLPSRHIEIKILGGIPFPSIKSATRPVLHFDRNGEVAFVHTDKPLQHIGV